MLTVQWSSGQNF